MNVIASENPRENKGFLKIFGKNVCHSANQKNTRGARKLNREISVSGLKARTLAALRSRRDKGNRGFLPTGRRDMATVALGARRSPFTAIHIISVGPHAASRERVCAEVSGIIGCERIEKIQAKTNIS